MKEYQVYYLVNGNSIVAGPFPTVDAAVDGKKKFMAPFSFLLTIVKSIIVAETI